MVAYFDASAPTGLAWGAEYHYLGSANTTAVVIGYSSGPAMPPPETDPERVEGKSKAHRAREQMRAYLAQYPRLDVSERQPLGPVLVTRDPLRHLRQRAARRQPRLSYLQRSA